MSFFNPLLFPSFHLISLLHFLSLHFFPYFIHISVFLFLLKLFLFFLLLHHVSLFSSLSTFSSSSGLLPPDLVSATPLSHLLLLSLLVWKIQQSQPLSWTCRRLQWPLWCCASVFVLLMPAVQWMCLVEAVCQSSGENGDVISGKFALCVWMYVRHQVTRCHFFLILCHWIIILIYTRIGIFQCKVLQAHTSF